jgi:hypothetical protein
MNPSTALTLQDWQILFHEAMAAVLRAEEAVKRQLGFFGVLKGLWKCARDLQALKVGLKAISELPDGVLTDDQIQAQIPQLQKLLRSIEELIDTGKRHGLTNRTLTAASLGSIRISGESIADYLETLEMSMDPEVLKAIEEGHSQIERGEFEVMEHLF